MKLLVTVNLDIYPGYIYRNGTIYNNKAIIFNPSKTFTSSSSVPWYYMSYAGGCGEAIRKAKPVNPKHDYLYNKPRRFIRNL